MIPLLGIQLSLPLWAKSALYLYWPPTAGFRQPGDRFLKESQSPLPDALVSAFAMFSLKDPSLLAFQERRSDPNLKVTSQYPA